MDEHLHMLAESESNLILCAESTYVSTGHSDKLSTGSL